MRSFPRDGEGLPQTHIEELEQRLLRGEARSLARAISLVEAGAASGELLMKRLRPRGGGAGMIGVTGSPGSGKSTLTDGLVAELRARGDRAAVIAVDPSSPFTGGAILGDRIRMSRWHSDPGVFIRSMATRGQLGGLAAATLQVAALLDAAGFPHIVIETVGVGQSEVDIAQAADTTILVLSPGQGDTVQAFKAGIMEIADLFVINKADHPGAQRLRREVKGMLEISLPHDAPWKPPIVETIASRGEGLGQLMEQIDRHRSYLAESGEAERLRRRRVRFEISATLHDRLRRSLAPRGDEFVDEVLEGRMTPSQAVELLLRE